MAVDKIIGELKSKIKALEIGKEYASCPECVQKDIDLLKDCVLTISDLYIRLYLVNLVYGKPKRKKDLP